MEGKIKRATCKHCVAVQKWPLGMKPISFLAGENAQYTRKTGKKTGQWYLDNFDSHENHKGHLWAVSGGRVDLFDFGVKHVPKPKISEERRNFIDAVLWLAVEDSAVSKIDSYVARRRHRGDKISGSRKEAWDIIDAAAEVLRQRHLETLKNSDFHTILFDEGSDDHSSRAWLAISMLADTMETPAATQTDNFVFALSRLWYDQVDAPGFIDVINEIEGINWLALPWIGADGAEVNAKAAKIVEAAYNPRCIRVWCRNHLGSLLVKDCIYGVPELAMAVDLGLAKERNYFYKSPKTMSRLEEMLPEDWQGPRTLKMAEKLMRWSAIRDAAHSSAVLWPIKLRIYVKMWGDPAERRRESRFTTLTQLVNWGCDYRNLVSCVFMAAAGDFFVIFHQSMQSRDCDFSKANDAKWLLNKKIVELKEPKKQKTLCKRVERIMAQCDTIQGMDKVASEADVEVRIEDRSSEWIADVMKKRTTDFLKLFEVVFHKRLPNENYELAGSFSIFEPEKFPDWEVLDEKKADFEIKKYGKKKLKRLSDWYGKPKQFTAGEREGEMCAPVVNAGLLAPQWETFKAFMRAELPPNGSVTTFRQLVRAAWRRAKRDGIFASRRGVSEILILLQIAEIKPMSSVEPERMFSALKRVVGDQRTSMTDSHVENCVILSCESRRMFGPHEKWKISDELTQEIEELCDVKRKAHSDDMKIAYRERKKRKMLGLPNPKRKKRTKRTLSDSESDSEDESKHDGDGETSADLPPTRGR